MAIPVESSKLLVPTRGALGAVVHGVDVSTPLPADTILALKQGLLDHHILIFQGQDLSEERRRKAEVSLHPETADQPGVSASARAHAPE